MQILVVNPQDLNVDFIVKATNSTTFVNKGLVGAVSTNTLTDATKVWIEKLPFRVPEEASKESNSYPLNVTGKVAIAIDGEIQKYSIAAADLPNYFLKNPDFLIEIEEVTVDETKGFIFKNLNGSKSLTLRIFRISSDSVLTNVGNDSHLGPKFVPVDTYGGSVDVTLARFQLPYDLTPVVSRAGKIIVDFDVAKGPITFRLPATDTEEEQVFVANNEEEFLTILKDHGFIVEEITDIDGGSN